VLIHNTGLIIFLKRLAISSELLQAPPLSPLTLFLNQALALAFLLCIHYIAHGRSGAKEVGVVGVDVGSLDGDERLDIRGGRPKTLSEKV
jgi:hypothetical protein